MNNSSYYSVIENDIIYDNNISNLEFRLYVVISGLSNNKNGYCYLTYSQLTKKMNISKSQFYRCINVLVKNNYIIKIKNENTQRVYLQPVMNRVIALRKYKNDATQEINQLFNYDWLNERI